MTSIYVFLSTQMKLPQIFSVYYPIQSLHTYICTTNMYMHIYKICECKHVFVKAVHLFTDTKCRLQRLPVTKYILCMHVFLRVYVCVSVVEQVCVCVCANICVRAGVRLTLFWRVSVINKFAI